MTGLTRVAVVLGWAWITLAVSPQGGRFPDIAGLHLEKKHQHLLSRLSNYELVRPSRCTQDGGFLSNDLSTGLEEERARSAEAAGGRGCRGNGCRRNARAAAGDGSDGGGAIHFAVDAFSTHLVLSVKQDSQLVAPGLEVVQQSQNGTTTTTTKLQQAGCFYQGSVDGVPGSSVAVSTCDGLTGLIQAGQEEYVIEPLESVVDRSRVNSSEGHLHVVYRSVDFRLATKQLRTDFQFKVGRSASVATPGGAQEGNEALSGDGPHLSTPASGRRYMVETLLVADHSMVVFHGSKSLPHYLLSMLNIVNRVYRHQTLEVDVQFVAIKIMLLNKATSKKLIRGKRYKQSMTNIFTWVSTLAPPGQMLGTVADYVSFVTHLDFGPAGFAPVSAMCEGFWSTSITRDQGLMSAFVMAHEAGHVLGMEHDGDGNSCVVETYAPSIMNELVVANFGNYFWTTCSSDFLKADPGAYSCMEDTPFLKSEDRMELQGYPGEWYTPDQQCQHTFGSKSHRCGQPEDYHRCTIRCSHPSNQLVCYEYTMTALDGRPCGDGDQVCVLRWCMEGVCVDKPAPRHGKWGQWSDWTQCSYNCSVGVRSRTRRCDNPRPAYGGRECKGKSLQFKICNTHPCTEWADRRAEQCRERLAVVMINGKLQTWLPHQSTNESYECRLTCMAERSLHILGTPYLVTDGTPCSYDDRHSICVQGKCRKLGCNKRLGSPKVDDKCGVCNGDGSSCTFISKFFANSRRQKRYQKMHTFPAGAYNIEVREQTNTSHFIALRYQLGKSYVLNGAGAQRGWPSFVAAGAHFQYSSQNDHLTSRGPIHADMDFLIYWTKDRQPVNITYSYYLQRATIAPVIATDLHQRPLANS